MAPFYLFFPTLFIYYHKFLIGLFFLFLHIFSNQLCINTAIVYMHRFYAFHSFTQFHQNGIAMASLFLAAKVNKTIKQKQNCYQIKFRKKNNMSNYTNCFKWTLKLWKVEEQPRKLESVIQVAHICIPGAAETQNKPESYTEQAQDIVFNENILLQTLGFDVAVDHPHTHVVKAIQLVRGTIYWPSINQSIK